MSTLRRLVYQSVRILSIIVSLLVLVTVGVISALAASPSGSISGAVKDAAGSPLANISVNAGDNLGVLTDANGNYVFKDLPFGQYSVVSPARWGSSDGTYISQTRDTAISTNSPNVTGVDFFLVKGGSISGTVKDAAGSLMANISVNAGNQYGALTDANGYFIIKGLPFGQYSVVSPARWGSNDGIYISQTVDTAISANSPNVNGVDFFLVKGGSISGAVKDAAGSPLANISVNTGDQYGALTDANGYFIIKGLPFGQYSFVSPARWGSNDGIYISQTVDTAISANSPNLTGVDFFLVKGGSISGVVKDAAGSPLANISVNAGDIGRAWTDADGNYAIMGLPFGQYSVVSPARWGSNDGTYISQTVDTAISANSPNLTGVDFFLVKGGSISGAVKDAAGSPLANISVNFGEQYGAWTDADGNYAIMGLPFGQYSVVSPARWGSNDGTYISQTVDTAISANSPNLTGVDFFLVKGGSISGAVKDAAGSPLANISVNAGDTGRALTDANGYFIIKGLPFGQYSVVSPARWGSNDDTYIIQTRDTAISANLPYKTDIYFFLMKGGSISGTVKDAAGSPLANISVNAGDRNGVLTDANGYFVIKGLPFGQYSVVSPARWGSNDGTYIGQTVDTAISANSPNLTGVDFFLVKGGSISGVVKDTAGSPLANISVNAGDTGRALTDATGSYVIKDLPFGQYSVVSPARWGRNDSKYRSQTRDIAISAASDVKGVDFGLVASWPKQDIIIVLSSLLCGASLLFYIILNQKHKLNRENSKTKIIDVD